MSDLYPTTNRPAGSAGAEELRARRSVLTVTYENVSAFAVRGGFNPGLVLLLDTDGLPVESTSSIRRRRERESGPYGNDLEQLPPPYFPGRVTRLRAFLQFE